MSKKKRTTVVISRAEFVQDQKRQVFQDRRTKRNRTRQAQLRRILAEQ